MSAHKLIEYAAKAAQLGELKKSYTLLLLALSQEPENQVLQRAVENLEKQINQPGSVDPLPVDRPQQAGFLLEQEELQAILLQIARNQARLAACLDELFVEIQEIKETIASQASLLAPVDFQPEAHPADHHEDAPALSLAGSDPENPDSALDEAITQDRVTREESKKGSEQVHSSISKWFADRAIGIRSSNPGLAFTAFGSVAQYLGENYAVLGQLYEKMKRSLATQFPFQHTLQGQSQEVITITTQFCNTLHELAILTSYWYDRNTRTVRGKFTTTGEIKNFMNGGWLEIYVARVIESFLKASQLPYTKVYNPVIEFSNGDAFELDLLYLVNGEPLWVECKTGDYQNYVQRYSDMRRRLGVPTSRSILLITQLTKALAKTLSDLHFLTFTNLLDFPGCLAEIFGSPLSARLELPEVTPPAEPVPDSTYVDRTRIRIILNKHNLRPLPEIRARFLSEVVAIFRTSYRPAKITDHKDRLSQALDTSNSKIQDLLNALKTSGVLMGADGSPINSFLDEVYILDDTDIQQLDERMCQVYLDVLRREGVPVEDPRVASEIQAVINIE